MFCPVLNLLSMYFNMLVSNHFHSVKSLLFPSARPHDFDGMLGTELPVSMYTMKTETIDMWCFNVPQLLYINIHESES